MGLAPVHGSYSTVSRGACCDAFTSVWSAVCCSMHALTPCRYRAPPTPQPLGGHWPDPSQLPAEAKACILHPYIHTGWASVACLCTGTVHQVGYPYKCVNCMGGYGRLYGCMYVCMYDYMAVSTRTLTPPTTGTEVCVDLVGAARALDVCGNAQAGAVALVSVAMELGRRA